MGLPLWEVALLLLGMAAAALTVVVVTGGLPPIVSDEAAAPAIQAVKSNADSIAENTNKMIQSVYELVGLFYFLVAVTIVNGLLTVIQGVYIGILVKTITRRNEESSGHEKLMVKALDRVADIQERRYEHYVETTQNKPTRRKRKTTTKK